MEYKIKGSKIKYLTFSKEDLMLINTVLETNEKEMFLKLLFSYVYMGIEPTFSNKSLKGVWDIVLEGMQSRSQSYLKKVEMAKETERTEEKLKNGERPKKYLVESK